MIFRGLRAKKTIDICQKRYLLLLFQVLLAPIEGPSQIVDPPIKQDCNKRPSLIQDPMLSACLLESRK